MGVLSVWLFIQNLILGMKWLNVVIGNSLSAEELDISKSNNPFGVIQYLLI